MVPAWSIPVSYQTKLLPGDVRGVVRNKIDTKKVTMVPKQIHHGNSAPARERESNSARRRSSRGDVGFGNGNLG